MMKEIIFIFLLFIFFSSCGKGINLTIGPNAGKLTVNSTPEDAEVYLVEGGKYYLIGVTPLKNFKINPGNWHIAVIYPGYETWERTIRIYSQQKITITAIFQPE